MPLDQLGFVIDDVFTLASMIAWLRTKPPEEGYCYMDHGRCLWGQYLIDHGYDWVSVGGREWRDSSNTCFALPGCGPLACSQGTIDGWGAMIAVQHPHTFGAALDRALRYQAEGIR